MNDAPVRLRPMLDGIPVYRAGAGPAPRQDVETFKISSNENPYGPLPSVLDAVAAAATTMNRYPDPASRSLVDAIAARFRVAPDQVATGTGSVAICQQLVNITCDAGDEVVYAWRSFEAHPIVTRIGGAVPVEVPLREDETHDLDAMADAITDRTRLVMVCTPNNPTGTAAARRDVLRLLERVPRDVVVCVDEAYAEFVRDPLAVDGLQLSREYDNVVCLRTFSKAYGLAGLRLGFAIAHPAVAEALRKVATPFGVPTVSEVAAVASLRPAAEAELIARVDALVEHREHMVEAVRAQGWTLADQQANFLWLRTGERTAEVVAAFDREGLTLRPFPGEGVRISVAEPAANIRTLDVLASLASRRAAAGDQPAS